LVRRFAIYATELLDFVCGSVAEAEYGSCFVGGQKFVWLRTILATDNVIM
jgi:hypothetical protein